MLAISNKNNEPCTHWLLIQCWLQVFFVIPSHNCLSQLFRTWHNAVYKTSRFCSIQKIILFYFSHETFEATRRSQCTCMSLYNIYFSVFRPVSWWKKHDTEYFIEKDNALHKFQNTYRVLICEDCLRAI